MFRGVSAFLLFLSAAIPTVSAFGAPTVLPTRSMTLQQRRARPDFAAAQRCGSPLRAAHCSGKIWVAPEQLWHQILSMSLR